ncbi:hypothetical protein NGB36_09240 [Streptomyces sp. RB6PN25]|uniref:Secreted protein n=1 Tax=Streptomyces humicola TaxID=2953240 RepID=A0ABT1PW69_9ACTN|nr:hypothetical protein [Streptomyces humicola]MCQ4080780.1 hypothetical protein [Streptomyces humicola]
MGGAVIRLLRLWCRIVGHPWCACMSRCPEPHEGPSSGYGNCTSPHVESLPAHCGRCGFEPPQDHQ